MKLLSRDALIALRQGFAQARGKELRKILVCTGTGCMASGSMDIYNRLAELIRQNNIPC